MSLKAKLLLGFFVTLLLTGVTAFMSFNSMESMDKQARIAQLVEAGSSRLLQAQSLQMRYSATLDKALASNANTFIDESSKRLAEAESMMWSPERISMTRQLIDFLAWYKQGLVRFVQANDKYREAELVMQQAGSGIGKDFVQLRGNILESIRSGNTSEAAFLSQEAVETARVAFIEARLASRVFTSARTPENAKRGDDQLALTKQGMDSALGTLVISENVALGKNIARQLEQYTEYFNGMTVAAIEANTLAEEIQQKLSAGLDTMNRLAADAIAGAQVVKEDGIKMSLAVAAAALVIGLGIALFLSGNVQKQLGKDPSALAHIADRVIAGDYAVDDGSPRIGVYGNLVRMVGSLQENIENAKKESERAHSETARAQEAMQQAEAASNSAQQKTSAMLAAADRLESVASIVSSASTQLSAQIEQSERGASEQASRVTETATAMEEMNSTVLEVARNASAASEVSASTRQKAENGARIVQQAVQSIQAVQEQSQHLKADMAQLDENAQSISQIMGVISDIADQTNLLALNAAIEAARAGEAGRGFAVVADEVRKLAEKTMASTTDVGNAIRAIQLSASKSMEQVDNSTKVIEEATGYANQSGAALNEIVLMVDNTADQVRAIATASEQQSSTSDEISRSINHVNGIAGETARAMAEAARAVTELSSQAQVLSGLIDDMKRG